MGIEITRLGDDDRERWNEAVRRSSQTNALHQYEALELIARISNTELIPLVGYRGQEPFGLFPVFAHRRGPFNIVRSTPSATGIHLVGPALLNYEKLKQRKREKRHCDFVDACLDWLDERVGADHVELMISDLYPDVRPFIWNDFDVKVKYTYVLDLSPDLETLLREFSKSTRRNIRNGESVDYAIREEGREGVRKVSRHLRQRYRESDVDYFEVPEELLVGVYDALPDGEVRPYTCYVDGEFAGGMIVLEFHDTAYFWKGGAKSDASVPVNTYLHWHVIQQAKERGLENYHIVGANAERVAKYKSKFGPELRPMFKISRETPQIRVATELVQRAKSSRVGVEAARGLVSRMGSL